MAVDCAIGGAGQHRALACVVGGVDASHSTLRMDWPLSAALYCDVDELRRRTPWPACVRQFRVEGDAPSATDIESPEYGATAHALALEWTLDGCSGDLALAIPFHVRYLAPAPEASFASTHRAVAVAVPAVSVDGVPRAAARGDLVIFAPAAAGGAAYAAFVACGTLGALVWAVCLLSRRLLVPPGATLRGVALEIWGDLRSGPPGEDAPSTDDGRRKAKAS